MRYAKHLIDTPQSEPLEGQVENSAGGYSFAVDDWKRLDRFLILGSEGGSYYASERKLTRENAQVVERCLKLDLVRTIDRIVEISQAGRAPKNDPALFALAIAAASSELAARDLALGALPRVARIGTHLFQFVDAVTQMRGWGRSLRDGVAAWYTTQDPDKLALNVIKYRQRGGWSHRDLLRLSHAVPGDKQPILRFAATGKLVDGAPPLIEAFVKAQEPHAELAPLIEAGITWEMIPTERLGDPKVWKLLIPKLPMTALMRNLARMTASGALQAMTPESKFIAERIVDQEMLRKASVHPIQVLAAGLTYASGHGVRGSLAWTPVAQIVDALDQAFVLAFGNVKPSGVRLRIALDVSGSMNGGTVAGVPGLTPRVASSALAMVWARTEPQIEFLAFSDRLIPVDISKSQSVRAVCQLVDKIPFGGTDCSLPIVDAEQSKVERDGFIVLTDSETWAGNIHPSKALQRYRRLSPKAKLAVVGMISNDFTIADPNDGGMLDVVGFDLATPDLICDFMN